MLAALSLAAAAGCGASGGGTVCTANFAYTTAVVVDAGGQPLATTWVVTDTVLRTARPLSINQVGFPAGSATVFSDANLGDVRAAGDSVRVTGAGVGKAFTAIYQFGSDGCHVSRIAGPDTVVAR